MTPNLNTQHTLANKPGSLPGQQGSAPDRAAAPGRRTSPLLTARELRALVSRMVD